MPRVKLSLRALAKSDSGVTALEYGLILAIIAVVIVGALTGVGDKLPTTFEKIPEAINEPKDEPKDKPKDEPKDKPKDEPKDEPKDKPRDEPKDEPKDGPGIPREPTTKDGGGNSTFAGRNASARGAGANQSNRARAPAGNGGHSAGSGASKSGAGTGGQSGRSASREARELFGRDSTSGAPWGQTAMLPSSAMAGGFGKGQSSGQHQGASNNSEKTSALILLLWLCLGIGLMILAWKMVLRTAEKKEAEEQMEDWEPASSHP